MTQGFKFGAVGGQCGHNHHSHKSIDNMSSVATFPVKQQTQKSAQTLNPQPYTLHPKPPTPYTLHPTPTNPKSAETLHPTPYILHPRILNLRTKNQRKSYTLHPKPPNPKPPNKKSAETHTPCESADAEIKTPAPAVHMAIRGHEDFPRLSEPPTTAGDTSQRLSENSGKSVPGGE